MAYKDTDLEKGGTLKKVLRKFNKRLVLRRNPGSTGTDQGATHDLIPTPEDLSPIDMMSPLEADSQLYANMSDVDSAQFLNPPNPQSNKMSIIVGVFVAVGGFLYGYDTGLINNITEMNYVKRHFAPNKEQFTAREMSILVSFLSLGTFFGALTAPFISDSYGRKTTVIFSTFFVFMIGNSLQVAATSIGLLVAGRFLSGFSVGLISAVVPLYQGEAAQKWFRGAIISTYQWAITWGLLVSSAVSQGTHMRNDPSSYRIPIGLQYVWAFVLGLGMIFLPESPRYYVLKDQLDRAAKSLSFLRGVPEDDSGLLEELVEIKATYDYEMSFGKFSYLDCFRSSKSRSKQKLRMFTGIAIQAFQQFSGINFIFYYGVNFFSRTGVGESYLVSFITYAVNVAFNVPGLFLIEYIGRRRILIFGGIIMTVSNFIVAIVGCSTDSLVANKVMIAFICLFIASFSATWGGAVWVISAELYPLGLRSKCTAICAASNWLVNFICALITPYLVDTGSHTSYMGTKIFFIWGSLNATAVVVVYFTVYETSGLTLEEIDQLYKLSPSGMASYPWNKKIKESPTNIHVVNDNSRDTGRNGDSSSLTDENVQNDSQSTPLPIQEPDTGLNSSSYDTKYEESPPFQGTESLPHQYVDLGNGLALTTYNRGPPSLLTDSSDDEEESGSFPHGRDEATNLSGLNEYMAQLMNNSVSYGSNATTNGSGNDQQAFDMDEFHSNLYSESATEEDKN